MVMGNGGRRRRPRRPEIARRPSLPRFPPGDLGFSAAISLSCSGRQLLQAPNEVDQLPGVDVVAAARAPRGHAGQADAVFDDPVELAVGLVLCLGRDACPAPSGKQTAADLGVAAAVVGVARGAMVGEVRARLRPRPPARTRRDWRPRARRAARSSQCRPCMTTRSTAVGGVRVLKPLARAIQRPAPPATSHERRRRRRCACSGSAHCMFTMCSARRSRKNT